MKIAVTGSNGFISKNLIYNLIENKNLEILKINRKTSKRLVNKHLLNADVICHFAGVNRPSKDKTFAKDNIGLTSYICNLLEKNKKKRKLYSARHLRLIIKIIMACLNYYVKRF